jgi:hypothetical protein
MSQTIQLLKWAQHPYQNCFYFFFKKKKLSLFSIKINAPTNIIELWAKIKRDMAPTYGHVIGTT